MSKTSDTFNILAGNVEYFVFKRQTAHVTGRLIPAAELKKMIVDTFAGIGKTFNWAFEPKDPSYWLYTAQTINSIYPQIAENIEKSNLGDCDDKSQIASPYWFKLVLKDCPVFVIDGFYTDPADGVRKGHEFYAIPTTTGLIWKNTAQGITGYDRFIDGRIL